jgi:hypothetical protein
MQTFVRGKLKNKTAPRIGGFIFEREQGKIS